MLPIILAAVGAYLIGDSVLEDKKSFEHGGMMAKGGLFGDKKHRFIFEKDGEVHGINYELIGVQADGTKDVISEHTTELGAEKKAKIWQKTASPKYVSWEIVTKKFANGGMMAKGGSLSKKANYIPKYDINSIDVEKNGKDVEISGSRLLDGVYVKKGKKMAKGGDVQGKTSSKHQDAQRFAKPSGERWKEKAVKKGVIKRSDLSKSPSKANQEKYPNLVYSEKRSDKSDKNPSYKYTSLAKGGKTNEFADVYNDNVITEKQINLIKTRLNNGKVEETRDIVDYIWNNNPKLSGEQNSKGIKFLMNLWKSPTGKERTNNPFGYREQDALETFEYFELAGFSDISRYGQRGFYVPLYNVIGKDSSFQYYYDGKMNIVG
jgi:hypothetical protein